MTDEPKPSKDWTFEDVRQELPEYDRLMELFIERTPWARLSEPAFERVAYLGTILQGHQDMLRVFVNEIERLRQDKNDD